MTFMSYKRIKVRCISETIQFTEYLMYFLLQARDLLLNRFSSKIHFLTCHMDVGKSFCRQQYHDQRVEEVQRNTLRLWWRA